MKISKLILLLFIVLKSVLMIAQDTIFIYDTIIVYDTVYIYDTIRTSNLQSDTNDIYSSRVNKSIAEISIKDCTITPSKLELEKEKKTTKRNNNFGVKLGAVLFGTNDNIQSISNPKTFGGKIGFYYRYSMTKKIGLRFGVDYLYNSNNKKAKARTINLDNSSQEYLALFNEEVISLPNSSIGDIRNLHIIKYHGQLAIPLLIEMNFDKIKPFIGIEYRYKLYEGIAYESFRNDWGGKFGVTYQAFQKTEFMLNFYKGLTNEQESIIGVKLNSYSLGCSVLHQF